ncbi:hypothetical protein M3J07_007847 [Ascochyta lentis]
MELERPAKRIRQACEQCRRTKSKCSGERPICGTCWRLGQQCYYYGMTLQPVQHYAETSHSRAEMPDSSADGRDTSDVQNLDNRMVTLESTVNKIFNILQSTEGSGSTNDRDWSPPIRPSTQASTVEAIIPPLIAMIGNHHESSHIKQLKKAEIEALGNTYLTLCACQPLPLFPKDGFVESLFERSDAVLFAIIASSLQHVHVTNNSSQTDDAHAFREAAQSLVTQCIASGNVGIATMQALCLVVCFDFGNGNTSRALSLISLTSMLAHSVDFRRDFLHTEESNDEESRCCYWSIVLLRRLLGVTTPLAMTYDSNMLPYPSSCSMPAKSVLRVDFKQVYEESEGGNGVMVFVLEMSKEWANVMVYVRECLASTPDVSPWLTTSRYSAAMSGVMSIETRLPPLHRYKHVTFRDLTLEDLRTCREYWAPWLLSRFLYHTMVCLLNHPLLITLQLQAKENDSELFRQQASFYVARHVRWILHFIAFIEARSFHITDPILGYCAAVVATIESQLIYSVDDTAAQKKQRNIESCRRFIRSLASSFTVMAEMDQKLEALGEVISTTYASNTTGSGGVFVDLSRIRDILDICPPLNASTAARANDAETRPPAAAHRHAGSSQWVRLSRRPSVDQPDDNGSPAHDQSVLQAAPQDLVGTPPVEPRVLSLQPTPLIHDPSVPFGHTNFPADLYFNGISQDVSTWWDAFDSYDPDCPGF